MLFRNSNCWNVIFAVTVGKIGISTLTGNPLGSLNVMKSLNLEKCLNGPITSSTFNNISTDSGKSELYETIDYQLPTVAVEPTIAIVALNALVVSLYTRSRPNRG
jgi:hypothetical protein